MLTTAFVSVVVVHPSLRPSLSPSCVVVFYVRCRATVGHRPGGAGSLNKSDVQQFKAHIEAHPVEQNKTKFNDLDTETIHFFDNIIFGTQVEDNLWTTIQGEKPRFGQTQRDKEPRSNSHCANHNTGAQPQTQPRTTRNTDLGRNLRGAWAEPWRILRGACEELIFSLGGLEPALRPAPRPAPDRQLLAYYTACLFLHARLSIAVHGGNV